MLEGRQATRTTDPFAKGPFSHLFEGRTDSRLRAREARRHAALAALVAWLPLVVLTVAEAGAPGSQSFSSLRLDVDTARYLVAIPLLILGQRLLTRRLNSIVHEIANGGYVRGVETDRMDRLLESTRRLLAHPVAAVGVLLVAYGFALFMAEMRGAPFATPAAGLWRLLVSQPLFLACVGVWLWRAALWARLVWCISTFHLRLSPAHPDRAGGLIFVSRSVPAFAPLAIALGTVAATGLRHSILIEHRSASEHVGLILALLAVVIGVAAGPLLPLARPIRRAQLRGIIDYGALANQVGRRFEERWLRRDAVRPDALSAPDFSATTDLYSIAANVSRMRLIPVDPRAVLALLLATLLPFVPVAFTTVPVSRLLHLASSLLL